MYEAFLLAMEAAGTVVDWFGTKQQSDLANVGAQLQQLSIQNNIQQTQLEAEDASLQAMKNLRQNLGTQIAANAARGTASYAGSALSGFNQSISNFNQDERMRRMNLLAKTTALRGQGLIDRLNNQGENTKLWSSFAQRTFNKLPVSSLLGGGKSNNTK